MIAPSLMLVLIVLFGFANQSYSQRCDLFDQRPEQCLSLPTGTFCGMPPATQQQIRQAAAANATINRIEQIGGPIIENSQEALQLGISTENPIVGLTSSQENFYRRCQNSNLLTPDPSGFTADGEFVAARRKRQLFQSNTCCSPSPNTVRVLASVDENGRGVELFQPPGLAQLFQDTTNCPSTLCTGNIACGSVRTLVPAEIFFLRPLSLGRANIVINICGAITTTPIG